jgi:PKD repeat protein
VRADGRSRVHPQLAPQTRRKEQAVRRCVIVLLWLSILLTSTAPNGHAQPNTWSLHVLEADAHHLVLELTLPDFESETVTWDGAIYHRLLVADWPRWGEPGQPQLPMCSVPVGMPWSGYPQVVVIEAKSHVVEDILPYPVPDLDLEETEDAPRIVETFTLDADAYSSEAVYPGYLTQVASIGFLHDQPMFQLRLYPFQYNPSRRELRVYHQIRVRVVFPEEAPSPGEASREQSSVVFEHILEGTLLNYDALPRSPHLVPRPPQPPPDTLCTLDSDPQVKLGIEQSGIYRVTHDDLLAAAPALLEGDPRRLELSNQGSAVPILFSGEDDGTFDPGDSLLFYGQAIQSDYTRQNVYWLSESDEPGPRMDRRDGTPSSGSIPQVFTDNRHYEQDNVYRRAVVDGEGKDHWFWSKLSVSNSTPDLANYTFNLHHIATSGPDGELSLLLYGATAGDHLTELYLNGVNLVAPAEQAWSGKIEKLYSVQVPQSIFAEGVNQLQVQSILPPGQTSSDFYVNWFEVTYQDTYVAEDDHLLFSAPAASGPMLQLSGFSTSTVLLLDITNPAAPVHIINTVLEPDSGGYLLRFSDSATIDRQYVAERADQLPTPSLQLDEPSAWRSTAHGATYLIITHPSFYDAVQPLATYRSGQGEIVAVVKTEDVYDEFNSGVCAPHAIRSFLEYTYHNWSPRPDYVLLVGDASRDPKNNLGSSLPDLLPAYYVDTHPFGQSANDSWYTKVHGNDDYPDLILGRIPARNASEIATVMAKIQTYEQSPPSGDWMRRVVLVADDGDPAFARDMDMIADTLPETVTPIKLYNYHPFTSVQAEVSAGASLFAYSGHGNIIGSSWGTWSGGHRIFNQTQMQHMWNGDKFPFMTVADCLSGRFDQHDRARAMAEEFLLLNTKGGIASWANASEGFPTSNSVILRELYQALLVDADLTLGSAATTARLQARLHRPDLPLSLFEVFTYFGDPAVRLNLPPKLGLTGEASPNPAVVGEPLTYTMTYTVSGADRSRDLTLINTLPQQVTCRSTSPPHSHSHGQTLTWELGDKPSGSYSVTIRAQAESTGLGHGQILQDHARLYDASGSEQNLTIDIPVHDCPITGLSASNDGPTALGDTTILSASIASGTHVTYTWDLGDGSLAQSGTPIQHVYPAVGTYTTRVTAANSVSSQINTSTVTIFCLPPTADFISSSPDMLGQTTTFWSISTGTNLSYQWDFGDNSSPVVTQSPTVHHAYDDIRTYTVTLTAINGVGSSAAWGTVEIVDHVGPPVASFVSSAPDEIGQTTVFVNKSRDGGDETRNVTYTWGFGDGTFSFAQHPTHTYTAVGTYPVSLTVRNSVAANTFYDTLDILDTAIKGLKIETNSPTVLGSATTLSATTMSGSNISYLWELADGASSTLQHLTHTYGTMGEYGVIVTATNSRGSQVATDTVRIVDQSIPDPDPSIFLPLVLRASSP